MDARVNVPTLPAQRVPDQPFLSERCTFACGALLDDNRVHAQWHEAHPHDV